MTDNNNIKKILKLEEQIREKQTSKLSANTLVPISLVITVIGFSFAIGATWQSAEQTKSDLKEFKDQYRQDQVELKSDIKIVKSDIGEIRVLLGRLEENMAKK